MLRAATLLLLLDACTGYSFRVCGNYCGPGWCNAQWEKEEVCDDSAETDGSCEDACCKLHDTCCGHKTPTTGKAGCNSAIVTCLDACSGDKVSKWCRDGLDIPISNRVIADAMDLVEGWCCGGPCPKVGGDDTDTPNASLDTPHVALAPNRSSSHAALAIPTLVPNRSSIIVEEHRHNQSVEEHRHHQSVEDVAKPAAGDLNHDGTVADSKVGDADSKVGGADSTVGDADSPHAALHAAAAAPNRSAEEHRRNQSYNQSVEEIVQEIAKPRAKPPASRDHDGTAGVSVEGDAGAEHTVA